MKKNRRSFTQRKSTGELIDDPNCIGLRTTNHILRLEHIFNSYVSDFLKNNLNSLLLQQKVISKPEEYKIEDHLNKINKKIGSDLDRIDVWIDESILSQKCLQIAERHSNQRRLQLEEKSKNIKRLALEIAHQLREDAFQEAVFDIAKELQTQYLIKIKHDPNMVTVEAKWQERKKRLGLHCQEVDKKYKEEMGSIASWNFYPDHV